LTTEWDARGVQKGIEYAILTDEISKAWSNMTTRQYKNLKGLKRENLRDNMSDLELVLNMLAEATTTEISKAKKPETFEENKAVARSGGAVAGTARKNIEAQTGKPVITSQNAVGLNQLVTNLIEDSKDKNKMPE
jgi:1,6-anhydro-N-acetylmuramate kinase